MNNRLTMLLPAIVDCLAAASGLAAQTPPGETLLVYATLTSQSPVGMSVEPYEMFDAEADAALVKAIQQKVWDVVSGHSYTGVPASKE